jgi:hypothetical protein
VLKQSYAMKCPSHTRQRASLLLPVLGTAEKGDGVYVAFKPQPEMLAVTNCTQTDRPSGASYPTMQGKQKVGQAKDALTRL